MKKAILMSAFLFAGLMGSATTINGKMSGILKVGSKYYIRCVGTKEVCITIERRFDDPAKIDVSGEDTNGVAFMFTASENYISNPTGPDEETFEFDELP